MNNVKNYIIIITISLIVGFSISYAWNNKTIEQQLEEQNTAILQDCLTKARMKEVPSEILESASHCNKDLLKTIYSPLYSRTGSEIKTEYSQWEIDCLSQFKNEDEQFTCWMSWADYLEHKPAYKPEWESFEYFKKFKNKYWTASTTPVSSVPLWFQLIQTAEAKSVESVNKELQIKNTKVSTTHSTIWDTNTWNVRTPKQIYEQVKHLWFREAPTVSIIWACKSSSSDIQKCILFWLIIMYNEAWNNQNSSACINRNNCFWVKSWKKVYSSLDEWSENWVQIFNRYWYKAEKPSFFYSSSWKVSKSRYCVSESSSNTEIWCPNWLKIANKKYEQLYPIIYLK